MTTWYEKYAAEHAPDMHVGGRENPYMLRWYLTPRDPEHGGLYLHKFIRDDEDRAMHDHPWPSISVVLSGKLTEKYLWPGSSISEACEKERQFKAGDTVRRSAEFLHRLIVDEPGFTLFMYGKRVREWGFLCPQGWRHWTRFVDLEDGSAVGPGCGEFGDPAIERTPLIGHGLHKPGDTKYCRCGHTADIKPGDTICPACGSSLLRN